MSSPSPHGGPPVTFVHGPYPRIDYAPGTVSDPPRLSVGDIHSPLASSAPTVSPGSTSDIGALGAGFTPPDDGDHNIGDIGHGASGIIPKLTLPAYDDLPPTTELPATSAVGDDEVPWQDEGPSQTPAAQTTSTTQVFSPRTVEIGVNQPWPGSQRHGGE